MIDYELYCKIKDYHQNRRLSVPQIARELSIDERTVSRWLNADKYRQREIVPRPSKLEPFKRHSIGTVKIDGPFIAGLESNQGINRLVVETVIKMAHSLGMTAIVEWVETEAQVEIVRSFNADAAQGYFFSVPLSSEAAAAMAAGPDVPQFSRTQSRTLVRSGDESGDESGDQSGGSTPEDTAGTPANLTEAVDVDEPVAGDVPPDDPGDERPSRRKRRH